MALSCLGLETVTHVNSAHGADLSREMTFDAFLLSVAVRPEVVSLSDFVESLQEIFVSLDVEGLGRIDSRELLCLIQCVHLAERHLSAVTWKGPSRSVPGPGAVTDSTGRHWDFPSVQSWSGGSSISIEIRPGVSTGTTSKGFSSCCASTKTKSTRSYEPCVPTWCHLVVSIPLHPAARTICSRSLACLVAGTI